MGDFVQVNVSNSQNDVVSFEKKFPKDIKIAELKVNLMYIRTFATVTMVTRFVFMFFFSVVYESSLSFTLDMSTHHTSM